MLPRDEFKNGFSPILSDWKKFLSLLFLLAFVAFLVFACAVSIRKYSGAPGNQIDLLARGSNALFEFSTSGDGSQYLILVTPHGWQDTGIQVEAGSTVSFRADGRVNMDGGGLFRTMLYRKNLEDKKKEEFNLDPNSTDEKQTPEYYLTEEEKKLVMLKRPWVDPDGLAPNTADERMASLSYGNRMERLELKGANLGSLVGKIVDGDKGHQPFKIGKKQEMKAATSGDLWLTINDIKNLQVLSQQMFYQDNLGFFWVVVTISREPPR